MAAICVSPIKATVARVIKLDSCGAPVTGAESAVVVQKGFVSISPSPQYEDGTEFLQKNADGDLCVNDIDPPTLKRVDTEQVWCVLDPDLLVLMTGERLLTTGDPVTGTGVVYGEGQITAHFSLEVWQPVSGSGACTAGGVRRYVYWAFPNMGNAMIGDWTFENGVFTFTLTATTFSASPLWGTGPGSAGPWIEQAVESGDHFLHNVTEVPPPTEACGAALLT